MGRLTEFLHSGRDGGNDDGWAVAIPYVVLDHKDGAVAAIRYDKLRKLKNG